MSEIAYPLAVILIGVAGLVRGYRSGLAMQINAVLGIAFGVVCARLFGPELREAIHHYSPLPLRGMNAPFIADCAAYGGIFILVYELVGMLTCVLKSAMQVLRTGMLDALAGALFCSFRYLMFVSICYNFVADINPRGRLVAYAGCHDGNVVEEVMRLAPAILDFRGIDDLYHAVRLEDARKIS